MRATCEMMNLQVLTLPRRIAAGLFKIMLVHTEQNDHISSLNGQGRNFFCSIKLEIQFQTSAKQYQFQQFFYK